MGFIPFIEGAGGCIPPSGVTVSNGVMTINANINISAINSSLFSGITTLTVNNPYILTVDESFGLPSTLTTISGGGSISIDSTYTLGLNANLTNLSITSITGAGTFAVGTYNITIPSGYTVSITSLLSGTGTLTVNGTCYYIGSGITTSTGDGQATFILALAGTGIFIGSPTGKGGGTNTITFSASAISANNSGGSGSAIGTGYIPYFSFSAQAIQGSAVGKYTIGDYNSTTGYYHGYVLIYIGTASTNFTITGYFGLGGTLTSGDTIYAYNQSGSAGTITLTGTLYV